MSKKQPDEQTVLWGNTDELDARTGKSGQACLIHLYPPGPSMGQRITLGKPTYVFGRDATADILLSTTTVSRLHAEVSRDENGDWWVRDLDSTNGTFVNERRIKHEQLRDGVKIRFGEIILKFLMGGDIETAYHEEIYRMTIIDGLTGIHNKRFFLDFLDREIARARRHNHALTLVMMDLDNFKEINDEWGHLGGDAVLKEFAGRVHPRIRREELFARYGGEEFAVVLSATALEGGIRFAEQLRELIGNNPFTFGGQTCTVTTSFGVATVWDQPNMETETLIQRADNNLYEAKSRGRNQVVPTLDELGK